MGNIIQQVGVAIGATASDYLLLVLIIGSFLWFRAALRVTVKRFESILKSDASIVKEHLDNYNVTHEKSWTALRELVEELKAGKVWKEEYLGQIQFLKDKNEDMKERIKDLDTRVHCIERGRRQGETG